MRILLLITCLLIGGCGSYFAPSPTSRPVAVKDLAGAWSYRPLASDANVKLVLKPDGTFEQTVNLSNKTLTQKGTWRIDGSRILLSAVLVDFRGWGADDEAWNVIDRDESPSGFAILGGSVDPDTWVILRWIH